jgi:endonuclease/exonuclease/phosphatase family metal-dependent hydrolase
MNHFSFFLRVCCIASVVGSVAGCGELFRGDDGISVVSYNLQNLFDGVSDGTEYPAFDPDRGSYSSEDYRRRLATFGDLLSETFPSAPSMLVFQEVENRGVATDLLEAVGWTHLYQHVLFDPAPVGSNGVAVASRLPVVDLRSHRSVYRGRAGRTILEARLGTGEIVLFANHWKSRRPSPEATEPQRRLAAAAVEYRLSVAEADLFLVVGDLNTDSPGLPALAQPWEGAIFPGSYFYQGAWERIDHILYGKGIRNGSEGDQEPAYRLDSFEVVAAPGFLTPEGHPRRWLPRHGGVSDHLPLVARFSPTGAGRSPGLSTRPRRLRGSR